MAGVCIAVSALTFQTLTGNRILTPAIMGYEAIYLLLQSLLVLLLGAQSLALLGRHGNALLSIAVMLAYSWPCTARCSARSATISICCC